MYSSLYKISNSNSTTYNYEWPSLPTFTAKFQVPTSEFFNLFWTFVLFLNPSWRYRQFHQINVTLVLYNKFIMYHIVTKFVMFVNTIQYTINLLLLWQHLFVMACSLATNGTELVFYHSTTLLIFWLHIILRKLSRLWKSTIIVEDKYNCTTAIDDAGEDEDDSIVCSRQRSEVMIGVSRSWLMIPIPNNEQHVPQQPNKHY